MAAGHRPCGRHEEPLVSNIVSGVHRFHHSAERDTGSAQISCCRTAHTAAWVRLPTPSL
jgi:hypothetical protein